MNRAPMSVLGRPDVTRRQGRAIEPHLARVGAQHSREHRHQGGFARPVLTRHRVPFTGRKGDAHVPQRETAREGLGDSGRLEQRGHSLRL